MGTSLKVHGFKKLVKAFAEAVHGGVGRRSARASIAHKVIYVNQTAPTSEWNDIIDYHVQCATDTWVENVVEQWKSEDPAEWGIGGEVNSVGEESGGGPVGERSKSAFSLITILIALSPSVFIVIDGRILEKDECENIPPSHDRLDAPLPATQKACSAPDGRPITPQYPDVPCSPPKRPTSGHVFQQHNTDDRSGFRTTIDSSAKGDAVDDCHADEDSTTPHSNATSVPEQSSLPPMPNAGCSLRSRLEVPMMLPPPAPPPLPRRLLPSRPQNRHDRQQRYNDGKEPGSGVLYS